MVRRHMAHDNLLAVSRRLFTVVVIGTFCHQKIVVVTSASSLSFLDFHKRRHDVVENTNSCYDNDDTNYLHHDDIDNANDNDEVLLASDDPSGNQNNVKWNWDPTSTTAHSCTIHRISRSELHRRFGPNGLPNFEYPLPVIIYPDEPNNKKLPFANRTSYENLPSNFPPNFQVTLSGSDSLSSHRRTISLDQYLIEISTANDGSGTTLPTQLGNETWYFFGETHSSLWSKFLQENYPLPPCVSCYHPKSDPDESQYHHHHHHPYQHEIALSFGIGNIGSGVQWHTHGPGFSETIHGRKHWVLYPPGNPPVYDLNYASRYWMEFTYPTLEDWTTMEVQQERSSHDEFWKYWSNDRKVGELQKEGKEGFKARDANRIDLSPSKRKPWECTVREGEIIYFPNLWHHATINLDKYTVFVSTFT